MEKVYDEDGVEYDVYYYDDVKTTIFKKSYTDEYKSEEIEKRREEKIRKERRM